MKDAHFETGFLEETSIFHETVAFRAIGYEKAYLFNQDGRWWYNYGEGLGFKSRASASWVSNCPPSNNYFKYKSNNRDEIDLDKDEVDSSHRLKWNFTYVCTGPVINRPVGDNAVIVDSCHPYNHNASWWHTFTCTENEQTQFKTGFLLRILSRDSTKIYHRKKNSKKQRIYNFDRIK